MSALPRFGPSTIANSLTALDTSYAAKAPAEPRSNRADASPQATRSAPVEKSKYQLWPVVDQRAVDQRAVKPLPGPPEPAAVPPLESKRNVRVRQSAEQMWLFYRKGDEQRFPPSRLFSKRTQSSPKNTPQPMLDVTSAISPARSNRRSCSAPGRTCQDETSRPHEDVSTRHHEKTAPAQQTLDEGEDGDVTAGEQRKSLKRASSVVLPAEWANVVFPKLQCRALDSEGRKIEAAPEPGPASAAREESENEIPPAVPPKIPPRKPVPNLHVSPLRPRPAKGPACDKALPQIGASETAGVPARDSPNCPTESKHVRDGSGDSVMDRGRPTTRNQSESRRGFMGSGRGSSIDLTSDILPKGWSANSVFANLLREEIRRLEHQARSQVGRFEVLNLKDVKALSQQVRLLDEQCEYLRGFAKSLRRNRRTLHAQTIAYLKSPALSEIPRQSMLQKVETLADLDDTIDEWAKKLERTEDQRLRARQRLLEHIAAVLAMPSVSDGKGAAGSALGLLVEHTPPQSPEGLNSPPMATGYDGESIKIYAGSEMHSLLGVLDKETSALKGAENVI